MNQKPIIYQLLPRLFTNTCGTCVPDGTIEQNGCGKLNHITGPLLESIRRIGVTHIWLTGVIEHATATDYSAHGIEPDNPHVVKGRAGSPYAIKDYYDIDPDLAENVEARMDEFQALVRRIHQAGMKVIIDFVPNHVARRYHSDAAPEGTADLGAADDSHVAFAASNNFYYIPRQLFSPSVDLGVGRGAYVEYPAKATGNDCFTAFPSANDWYETVKLNYGRDYANHTDHFTPVPDTWLKMTAILQFWASKGVDGFRCDMAHMVPLEFWSYAISRVKLQRPDMIFIAEMYETDLYRPFIQAGFDYLYDKVNLYDTLRAIDTADKHAGSLSGCWQCTDGIESHMLNFLENHDEQRYASTFYASDPVRVVPALTVSAMIGTGAFMVYMGQELGERGMDTEGFSGCDGRTTIFDYWSLESLRHWVGSGADDSALTPRQRWLRATYGRVMRLCNEEAAISHGRFFDVMYVNHASPGIDPARHFIFMRNYGNDTIVIAANFSDESADMQIRIPAHAFELWGIKPGAYPARELLRGGSDTTVDFGPDTPLPMLVMPHSAAAWKITHLPAEKKSRASASNHAKKA